MNISMSKDIKYSIVFSDEETPKRKSSKTPRPIKTTKPRKEKRQKSKASINKYKSLLRMHLMNEKLADYNKTFINLFDKTTNKHQPLSKETIRSCISAILWFIEDKKPNADDLLYQYGLFMTHLRKSCLYDTRNNNIYKQKQMRWSDILLLRDDYKKKVIDIKKKNPSIIINNDKLKSSTSKLNQKEKGLMKKYLISCIYTYNPPRRLLDYACMNVINNIKEFETLKKQKPNEIKKHNYYAYDNNVFIFCYYKTVSVYGEQYISVNGELDKIIKDYIYQMGLNSGDLLFGNKDFEQLVRNTFNSGINTIRHSYVSYVYESSNGKLNPNMIDKISQQMAHSVKTNIGYYKSKALTPELDTLTFTFHKEYDVFDNKKNIKLRMKNFVLMIIVLIVIKICMIRMKKYGSGKKKIEYIEETPIVYDTIDEFMK